MEEECEKRLAGGLNVTVARLGPVHGPGKERTLSLLRMARLPIVPLPNGGRHSIGFVLLDDALRALFWLLENDCRPVVSVGAGPTRLRSMFEILAEAQGRRLRAVSVPVPRAIALRADRLPIDRAQWALRLALPRSVEMDVPVPVTPLGEALRLLVKAC